MTEIIYKCDRCELRFSERRNGEMTLVHHGTVERVVNKLEMCERCTKEMVEAYKQGEK